MYPLLALLEGQHYTEIQQFVITAWGKLLYINYFSLPTGKDYSKSPQLLQIARDYFDADEVERDEDLDEWVSDGCPMKNGIHYLNQNTLDAVLASCQHPASKKMTLYRFDPKPAPLVPHAWISLTIRDSGYHGERREFEIDSTDLVIDTQGLADEGEYIVNTNVLLKK